MIFYWFIEVIAWFVAHRHALFHNLYYIYAKSQYYQNDITLHHPE